MKEKRRGYEANQQVRRRIMLRIMTRRWIFVLVLFVVGLVVTSCVYSLWPTVYEANSVFTMDVQAPKGDYDENSHEIHFYGSCYDEIFIMQRSDWRTKEFFSRTIRQFHDSHSNITVTDKALEEMLEKSKLERMGHTRRIKLTVHSQTADIAVALANTYVETIKSFTDERNKERCAKALADVRRQFERAKGLSNETDQELQRAENEQRIAVERNSMNVFVLHPARVPEKPIVPNPWVIFPTGAVLSLGLALVLRNWFCGCGSRRIAPQAKDSRL